jgi:hypothetical protein
MAESKCNESVHVQPYLSWKVRQNLRNVFAAQYGSLGSRTQDGRASNRIGDNPEAVRTLLAGCQNSASGFNVGIERITGENAKPATKRAREHGLAFA